MAELWDIYDKDRNPTGRITERGKPVIGGFHIVAVVWIINRENKFLIQRRAAGKPNYPLMWDCAAAGAALAGEDSLSAAKRETLEEIGVALSGESLALLYTVRRGSCLTDVWAARMDISLGSLRLNPEEVCDTRWASESEILELAARGEFCWNEDFRRVFKHAKETGGKNAWKY